jgi:hypothetical protein
VRKRKKLIALALGLAVISAFIAFELHDREPTYEGHPLSYWVERYSVERFTPRTDITRDEEVAEAIKNIGTNAIPFLLKWIAYQPSLLRSKTEVLVQKLPSTWQPIFRSKHESLADKAMSSFALLGDTTSNAIPALSFLAITTTNETLAIRSTIALAWIGPTALPALLAISTNSPALVRACAITAIPYLGRGALPAIPTIIKSLNDTDPQVSCAAAQTLGGLALAPELCIPALTSRLTNAHPDCRGFAANALASFGQAARVAIPQLLNVTHDPTPWPRGAATTTLHKIAPEVLTNAPAQNQ